MTRISEVREALSKDPIMSQVIQKVAIERAATSGNIYSSLVKSIVFQQISTKAAQSIYTRFLALFDGFHPNPQELSIVESNYLRTAGLSAQKASYILNIADYFIDESQDFSYWNEYTDQQVIDKLTFIKGVGEWTAQMVMMSTLERPDIFPVNDYGIKTGINSIYNFNTDLSRKEYINLAEKWRPFRTYASIAIWNWLALPKEERYIER